MSSGIEDSANINLDFGTKQITGFPAKAWCATKKYSVNNTLPTVTINTWLQFSSAYVAAVIITSNDVSFITNILSSQIMPAYILASVMLGIALVTFLVIKRIYTQEIKDEKLKDGNSTIDEKIRSGKTSGRSEIVQNALTVEIIPDMSLIGNKKENFSIILPISEKQEETLENKRQENRNKIILLTVPYVLSGLIIGCALAKFGFAYITGWKEWASIAVLGITVIVGICTTLSKFRSNEVNNAYNFVQNFSNVDILLPWRKGSVMSVMEKNIKDDEEDSPIVRALKEIAGELGNRLCSSVDRFLYNVEELLTNDLVGHVKDNMETLSGRLKNKIEALFNNLEKSIDEIKTKANNKIAKCLQNSSNSISQSLEKTCDDFKKRLDQIRPTRFLSLLVTWYSTEKEDNNAEKSSSSNNNDSSSSTDTNVPSEVSCLTQEDRKKINDAILNAVRKELEPIQAELTELQNLMQGSRINNSCNGNQRNDEADPLEDTVIEQRKEVRKLELRIESSRLAGRQIKLKEKLLELKETKSWKEKINGKPSEFLYYLLESIRLAGKDSKEIEAALRNFDNRVIIRWKDGSQTICYIKKQGDLQIQPSTKFVDLNMREAFKVARKDG